MERVNMTKITEPARKTFGHIQKMVRDIKKNEGGLIGKIKKLKNENLAVIRQTGKDTWDRITNKPPPNLPRRDYTEGENGEDEDQWSDDFDSDYENPDGQSDSETYVVPSEGDFDDSYEPPPTEADKRKALPPYSYSKGVYEDNQGATSKQQQAIPKLLPNLPTYHMTKQSPALSRVLPQPSLTPSPTSMKVNPPLPTPRNIPHSRPASGDRRLCTPSKEHRGNVDEDDYIVPVDEEDEDEDNYIQPTEEAPPLPSKPPPVNRDSKPTSSAATPAPVTIPPTVLYEVCEQEAKPSPPQSRAPKPFPSKFSLGGGGGGGGGGGRGGGGGPSAGPNADDKLSNSDTLRNNAWRAPPAQQRLESTELPPEDEYEICDPEDPDSNGSHVFKPAPMPRIAGLKTPNMANMAKVKLVLPPREAPPPREDKPTPKDRQRGSGSGPDPPMQTQSLPVNPKPALPKPAALPKPPEPATRNFNAPAQNNVVAGGSSAEQDAGVSSKEWYASACDRKPAEEALHKSNKDGSFLIRKSTGHDPQQPYTLVILFNRRVYNIPIRYIEATQQYALGREKSGEERFNSVEEMVLNHQRTPLVLIDSQNNTKDSTRLKHPVKVG